MSQSIKFMVTPLHDEGVEIVSNHIVIVVVVVVVVIVVVFS